MNLSFAKKLCIAIAMVFASDAHSAMAGKLPQVPNYESILSEESKKAEERIRQCTDAAIATLESAQDTAALKSRYSSGKTECIQMDIDINFVIEKAFTGYLPALQQSGASGTQIMKLEEKRIASYQRFSENRRVLPEMFRQNIQATLNSEETRLTAAYEKIQPQLAATETANARRKADEAFAEGRRRNEAAEVVKAEAAEEQRAIVYKLIGKERFNKLDALMSESALIASKNASAKMGFKEWTIGTDWQPSMTPCVSGFQHAVPDIFQSKVSAAQAAARDAFQSLLGSFQICVVQSTALEAPVRVVLVYQKGKLVAGGYELDLTRKQGLIDAMNGKYGKPAISEKKVQTKDDIMKEMRRETKGACEELKKGKEEVGAGMVAMLGDFNCDALTDTSPMVGALLGIPNAGSRVEKYIWKVGATEALVEYADFGRKGNQGKWKPFLAVSFESLNDPIDQLQEEIVKLTGDIVQAYSTNREDAVNKQRSKDF